MGAKINALSRATFAFLILLPAVTAADAPSPTDGDAPDRPRGSGQLAADRWVPSFSLISVLTVQSWDAGVDSEICRGCTFPDPMSEALRPSALGGDVDVTPFFGGSLELMTPEFDLPLSPRLFVGGEVSATFGFERKLAREADPGELVSPIPPGNDNIAYQQEDVLGQGSQTVAQLGSPFYGAYAGVSFPFQFRGRQLRLKPSVSWIRYDVKVTGLLVAAECATTGAGRLTNCNANISGGFQREIRLEGSQKATFDGIGPGVQLELDTPVLGPFGSALFLGARFYHIIGDRTVEFGDSASYADQAGVDQTRANFRYEADPWLYRLDIGVRFQWVGFNK